MGGPSSEQKLPTEASDVFSRWAAMPEWEQRARRFFPLSPEWEFKALAVFAGIGRILARPVKVYFLSQCVVRDHGPGWWKVFRKRFLAICRGG